MARHVETGRRWCTNESVHPCHRSPPILHGTCQSCTGAFTRTLAHERIEVEDVAVTALRFENGALGVIEGATAVYPGFLKRIEISGSNGTIVLPLEQETLT